MTFRQVKKALRSQADPVRAKGQSRFFKTGPGEYGEGDVFIGVRVPEIRKIVRRFSSLSLAEISRLLESVVHEDRLAALLILVEKFKKGTESERGEIFRFYTDHFRYINNWDLVDCSAYKIAGPWLEGRSKSVLKTWSGSDNLWERRIAVISTYHFIRQNSFRDFFQIAKSLLNDDEDLIQKAVGWMLREVGKADLSAEEDFLKKHYRRMPRTMLRYAIERFPENRRQKYLKGEV